MESYNVEANQYHSVIEVTDYRAMLMKYLRYWYLFIIGILLGIGGAYLLIKYSTPQYNINSTLLIKDDKKGSDSKNALFQDLGLLNTYKNIDNEVVVLKSTSLMHSALLELSLHTSYYVKGWAREQEVYSGALPFRLIIDKLDSAASEKVITFRPKGGNDFELVENQNTTSHQFGQVIHKPYGTFTILGATTYASYFKNKPIIIRFHDIKKLADGYAKRLRVTPVSKQTTVLTLSLTDAVPEKGQDILNKLVEVYNNEAAEDKNIAASNTISFIDERLKHLRIELSDVEKGVEALKQKNQVADVGSQITQSLEEASGYNKQISETGIQIEVLGSIENYINREDSQHSLIPSALSVQDATLSGLIAKYNELQLDRERMLRTALPSNPIVQNMSEQLTNLRMNILDNLKTTKNSLAITRKSLLAKSTQFTSSIQKVPTIERELLGINRQQELKNSLYLYLLQKREEAALSLAATVANSKVIDSALADSNPISPNKLVIMLLGMLLGLGLPFLVVYTIESLNNKVQLLKDVEQYVTTVPILGELMRNRSGQDVVVTKENRSPLAEMFRLVRTNLQFATTGAANRVVLVTSSMSGEGKTFFCLNLGASLVLAGKKTVLINLDLRKPTFESEDTIGLTDYLLSNEIPVDAIVKPSKKVPGLYVINNGPLPANPAEIMMSPKVGHLLHVLKESFDYIIIDTAPIGQVADAYILAPYISYAIYLIRYNFTLKTQLNLINKIRTDNRFNNLMLVLNDAIKNDSYGYGYGYNPAEKKKHKNENFQF